MNPAVEIHPEEIHGWQVAIAASLVAVSAAISLALRLGLERRLLLAAVRTLVQLLAVGFVLTWLFAEGRPYMVVVMVVMTIVAGMAAVGRCDRRYRGMAADSILSIWVSAWCMVAVAVVIVVQPRPWSLPQYWIPLLGMLLHNTLNGISLGLDRFSSELSGRRDEIETLLALGATRWEAARTPIQQAVRTGMIPTINTMMVVGLVSLPGMMTGQLLAGVRPAQAVTYQIVIMFLIAASASLGTVGVVLLGYRRLFNGDHQFLSERISRRR
ncbi:MAG: ABC transporter permease [Planctomycetota bacterium]